MSAHEYTSQTSLPLAVEEAQAIEAPASNGKINDEGAPTSIDSPIRDIYPRTPVTALRRDYVAHELDTAFAIERVAALTGMSVTYIRRALNQQRATIISLRDVFFLLDLDAFAETFVPRSRIPEYLLNDTVLETTGGKDFVQLQPDDRYALVQGSAKDLIQRLAPQSVQCVVTSTPYWGTRLYEDWFEVAWADGEVCPFGHEQTPEAFIRHTIELLYLLKPAMTINGSVWWNLMDTYNTRTQIRASAAETLRAMKGHDQRSWKDYECRRYSAGHSFLEDGEQCFIPARVAERASRIGYWTKSIITWKKIGSMPETVSSRVTREAEYIIHLAVQRAPYFNKESYNQLPLGIGGRNPKYEEEKLTDVWSMATSNGQDGHGAQFPLSLPARCIALSTQAEDLVVDPFIGSGTTAVSAIRLSRRVIGFDVSEKYLRTARQNVVRTIPSEQLRMLLEQTEGYRLTQDEFDQVAALDD